MKEYVRLPLIFIITLIISYFLYYTGIWALVVFAGLISSLILSNRYSTSLPISFISGLISSLLFLTINFLIRGGPIFKVAYYTGVIAGIPGNVFIVLSLVLSGVYCAIGSTIGTYINKVLHIRF